MPGPFYFAWVNAGTAFNPAVHNVWDEDVYSMAVAHTEGDFASLNLDVRNPKIGLLAPTRKTWAWLSWFNGTVIQPLFFGRLSGIPANFHQELVQLQFTARPADYAALKSALAETLKVAPYYDPIWIAEEMRSDPDTVLEAYSALYHIDRVTHAVSISDVLSGEDGNQDFLANEVPRASVTVNLSQPPLRSVNMDGAVNWTQAAKGQVTLYSGSVFHTFTGDGLISGWPTSGGGAGGGWEVAQGSAIDVDRIGDIPTDLFENLASLQPQPYPNDWIHAETLRYSFPGIIVNEAVLVPLWRVRVNLVLGYDVERQRTERVRFTLSTNVQPIVTMPGEDEALNLSISSVDVGEPLDASIPIGDVRRSAFFPTARGLQSVEYLIALARANLLLRSRAVEVEWQCRFERAIGLSLRMNARLFDDRLPGGEALGKIIGYTFSADGDSGELIGSVKIGCAIGYGGAIEPVVGTPTWVDASWVEPGWQQYDGTVKVLAAGDVGYSVPIDGPNDDGWNLLNISAPDVVMFTQVHRPAEAQLPLIIGSIVGSTTEAAAEATKEFIKTIPTQIELHLKPIDGGPFETAYDIEVSELEVPMMIDLESPT